MEKRKATIATILSMVFLLFMYNNVFSSISNTTEAVVLRIATAYQYLDWNDALYILM